MLMTMLARTPNVSPAGVDLAVARTVGAADTTGDGGTVTTGDRRTWPAFGERS